MQSFRSSTHSIRTGALILVTIVTVIAVQVLYDRVANPFSLRLSAVKRTLIPAEAVKHFAFGFDNALADYYWISSIQDFVVWNHKDSFYVEYFRNIATLDPKFEYPYLFSIFTAPVRGDPTSVDKVARIADIGITTLPNSWKIPFYMGTKYNLFNKDYDNAVKYIGMAAKIPTSPPGVQAVYSAITAKKYLGRDTSRDMIKVIYDNTDSATIKKLAERGLIAENLNLMLENGVVAYKGKFGRYPKTVNELLENNFIVFPKELGADFNIMLNSRTGAIRVIEK